MYELTFDLAIVFFFLAFLFFILKQKERYFEYHPQSWRALMLGGILLVLAFGTNLAFLLNQGEYAFTPRWRQIIGAIGTFGYVAGGALILFGLLKWCRSLVEVKRHATQRLRQLACLKCVLSVINHRRDLDEILKESLPHLMNIMGYKRGVIFKPTFRSSEMVLVAHAGVSIKNLFTLYDKIFSPCMICTLRTCGIRNRGALKRSPPPQMSRACRSLGRFPRMERRSDPLPVCLSSSVERCWGLWGFMIQNQIVSHIRRFSF